ncbi:MAG TPA: hypothetical protein VFG95_00850 [Nitrospiria bacterium]|nr:hypothetical protein [Nitrospiria bacterium]
MGPITIELGKERDPVQCPCCGQMFQTVYGSIIEDGHVYAIYNAGWSFGHKAKRVSIHLEIGKWGENERPEQRLSFGINCWSVADQYQYDWIDPDLSPWGYARNKGRMLTRAEALSHPLKDDVLRLAKHLVSNDGRIRGFLDDAVY